MGLRHPVYVNHVNKYAYIHTGVLTNKTNKIHIRIQNVLGLLRVHHILYKHTYTHMRAHTLTLLRVHHILYKHTYTHTPTHSHTHTKIY